MKLCINKTSTQDFTHITNHSDECDENTAFLVTPLSKKYLHLAKSRTTHIVDARELNKYISIDIKTIGITGTNGKTTVASIISFVLSGLGFKTATLGTMGFFINNTLVEKTQNTTPDTLEIYDYLTKARNNKCEFFIMEVSSHSISQNRIAGIDFEAKVHTNITRDHLDFHKSIQNYRDTKNSFLQNATNVIINQDDKYVKPPKQHISYSTKAKGDIQANHICIDANGINTTISYKHESSKLYSKLLGEFNLSNILGAIGAIKACTNAKLDDICKEISSFSNVSGRVEIISQEPLIIIDFAHTPDGMEKVFSIFKDKKISVVFGAGGDRDRDKRALMGSIASLYANKIYLSNDNPRYENDKDIIDGILDGIKNKDNVEVIYDRREAIGKAIDDVRKLKYDVLMVLGKGNEDYQDIQGIKKPFNDKEAIKGFL